VSLSECARSLVISIDRGVGPTVPPAWTNRSEQEL
jgi:hypothetical protein